MERTPHLPTALLLDLDDTILSYSAGADDLWRTLCEECGPRLNGCGPAQLLQNLDHVKGWYWSDKERHRRGRLDLQMARREIVRLTFERAGVVNAALADELADAFTSRREEMVVPFPGALDALWRLNALGVRLALITNGRSEFQRAKIERHGLARFFDCILIEGEFGVGKPDPSVYRHVLEQLRLAPADCWMVGDNLEWDVAGAQAVGITGVWHDYAGAGLPSNTRVRPDRIIRTLTELLNPGA